jgi:hypothetical protein
MHCLGDEGKTNLLLAKEEASKFDRSGPAATARLILSLVKNK